MGLIHLWLEEPQEQDGEITVGATLEHLDGRRDRLWYRIGMEHRAALTTRADPLVIGFIFPLMQSARKADGPVALTVHGSVSPSLLRNLEEFQMAWTMWRPDLYRKAAIRGEKEEETGDELPEERTVMCFSGGVDSSFTAYMHSSPGTRYRSFPLRAGVMVQGWEYGLEETALYLRAEERSKRILGSLGIPLIRVATNYREVASHWPHSHGAAVGSCLSLLQQRYRSALVAQTMTYANNHLSLEGVNPMTDWLFSSNSFRVRPDGAGYSRLDKILTIGGWPEFLENARVCWQDEVNRSENCCACEKCIRTILQFRALGLGLPPAFPHDVSDRQIEALPVSARTSATTYEPILREAKKHQAGASWVRSLERAVRRARRNTKMLPLARWRKLHYLAWRKLARTFGGV